MIEKNNMNGCKLADLLATSFGTARRAREAILSLGDDPDYGESIATTLQVLQSEQPWSDEQLHIIGELADHLREGSANYRYLSDLEGSAMPSECYTDHGKRIRDACAALEAARTAGASTSDRWRAEQLVLRSLG